MDKGFSTEEYKSKYDLEERLIGFGLLVIEVVELLPKSTIGQIIGNQLLRSGTSSAYNYGEAQVAESRNDFIHKMKICLKELKECNIGIQFILRKPLIQNQIIILNLERECKELISIFVKSIETANIKKLQHKRLCLKLS